MQGSLFRVPKVAVQALETALNYFKEGGKGLIQEATLIKEFSKIEGTCEEPQNSSNNETLEIGTNCRSLKNMVGNLKK